MRKMNTYVELTELHGMIICSREVVNGKHNGQDAVVLIGNDGLVQPVIRDNRGWFVCTTFKNIQEFIDQIESDGATWEVA